jgi:hypothetical protein
LISYENNGGAVHIKCKICEAEAIITDFNRKVTKDFVISELINNTDYRDNLAEILTIYFSQNPDALKEWIRWFEGKEV